MKQLTVIGAGGQMGQWFTNYFSGSEYQVTGYDSESNEFGKNVIVAESLVGAILKADYVILCTPTRRTPEIIRLIAKEMKRGTYLIEISSEKGKVVSSLGKMPDKINPICIHPMFGPGIKTVKNQNIISVPIKDAKKELTVAKELFEGANFVTIDAIEHDKKIAIILPYKEIYSKNKKQKHWVLALKAVGKIDLAGADLLIKTIREVKARGGTFRIVAHFEPLIKSLERLHVLDELGADKMYNSKFEAINAAKDYIDIYLRKIFTSFIKNNKLLII